ncbi:uncharacterized protein GGS25DRAFT_60850 [Hypoxylon fragiforme]|uniref:uncharacterized protein n=1 Tax=Hypoxylon fragiforme TaxID=63214 RepID=UPI0020C71A5A|nr:uncharacterized protein GGS25DRAFT_60850 [Hypoxylon fragiforme]KAI2614667.1 hypothetical protein GGS25DRAFT_60850 [Hypoxylon fragiforme]
MPPALISPCRQAIRHRIRPQDDYVWVSDALLATIFERYWTISRTVARYSSSVPGPLENRRRLGKRRMAGLGLGQPPGEPLWQFDNLADLTQWKWKSPSPTSQLGQPRDGVTRGRTLADFAIRWLWGREEANSTHVPDPVHDTIHDTAPDTALDTVPKSSPEIIIDAVSTLSDTVIIDPHSTPSDIIGIGLKLLYEDLSSEITMSTRSNFTRFCNGWKDHIACGLRSGNAVGLVLDAIQDGLSILQLGTNVSVEQKLVDKFRLILLEATTAGLSCLTVQGKFHPNRLAWAALFHGISKLQMNNLRVFAHAMAKIPECYLDDVSGGIGANLRTYLIASENAEIRSKLMRQVNKMAVILKKLDPVDHLYILEDINQCLSAHRESKAVDFPRMRLVWLQVLARLPGLDEDYLTNVCCTLEAGKDVVPLSNKEICEMYLAKHQNSLRALTSLSNSIQDNLIENDWECYGSFSLMLWRTDQYQHMLGLCEFLNNLGRGQDIMRLVKGFRILVKNEATPLANLAIGIGDPIMALEIYHLYEKSTQIPTCFWKTRFSYKILHLMTRSRVLHHGKILLALGVVCSRTMIVRQRPRSKVKRRQLMKAARAAMAFAKSPNISNRTALELITKCIRYITWARRNWAPTEALIALLHNITRDLAEGKPGRLRRLKWFLYLLRKQTNGDQMMKIGLGLKRWREMNYRRHLERVKERTNQSSHI